MNDLKNLRYKIMCPLKEVAEQITSCIYGDFCQYSSADIATAIVIASVKNRSLESFAKSPNPDTIF